ncbi:MAG: mitochondrial 54S ribosomal protein mrpl1 [Vezdaea aestivalis]|nr:MAG: mitochondrial 54S ribosomal protein mrpl1 [Vezdaea aestivalis]
MHTLQPWAKCLQLQYRGTSQRLPVVFLAPSLAFPLKQFSSTSRTQKVEQVAKKKKKTRKTLLNHYDLRKTTRFALCDAIRYIQAFEVGQPPKSVKYELAVKFRTPKSGPVARDRLQLPNPVASDVRICVICPPDSQHATAARKAGATVVGEDDVIAEIKEGRIEFDMCLCHIDSLPKLTKSGVARILGPKGLMPSLKLKTVVKSVEPAIKSMIGASSYRERVGVVRLAIGQLGFSPDELKANITMFMDSLKGVISGMPDKSVDEVVLSASHSPGFPLDGTFQSKESVPVQQLTT